MKKGIRWENEKGKGRRENKRKIGKFRRKVLGSLKYEKGNKMAIWKGKRKKGK